MAMAIQQPFFAITFATPVAEDLGSFAGAALETPPLQGALEMMGQGFADRSDLKKAAARFASDVPAFLAQKPVAFVAEEARAGLHLTGLKLAAASDSPGAPKDLQRVGAIAEAKAPGIYDFVKVSIHGTPIDRFSKNLGEDMIEHIKELLYSRLLQSYPELKNLPPEKFQEVFLFDFKIDWFSGTFGGGTVVLFISKNNVGYMGKYPIRAVDNDYFVKRDITEGDWQIVNEKTPENREWSWAQVTSLQDVQVANERIPELLRRIAEASDFTNALNPGQMEIILSQRYPELQVYFHLDRLLKLAIQNPEALTGYLKEEILKAERRIQELLRRKEIDEREASDRIAALRAEMRDLTERTDAARRELSTLEPVLADLKMLVEETVFGGSGQLFEVSDTVENLELIALADQKEAESVRRKVSSFVRAAIEAQLWALVEHNREKWEKEKVGVQVKVKLVGHQRSGRFLGRKKDSFEFILTARVETPSYRSDQLAHASFEWEGGETNGSKSILADSVGDLMGRIEDKAASLIVQETLFPRRARLIQLLTGDTGAALEEEPNLRQKIHALLRQTEAGRRS